jgi:hypothetical protein
MIVTLANKTEIPQKIQSRVGQREKPPLERFGRQPLLIRREAFVKSRAVFTGDIALSSTTV